MTTPAATTHHLRVSFGYIAKDIPGTLLGSQALHDGMVANPTLLASPPVEPAVLQTETTALATAQADFNRIGKSARPARDAAVTPLKVSVRTLVAWVQGLLDLATSEQAVQIAKASTLHIIAASSSVQAALKLANAGVIGEIIATVGAKAMGVTSSKNRLVEWEWSRDNGITWVDGGHSTSLKYTLTGLPSMVVVMVRARIVVANVPGPWSPLVSIPVH